MTKPPLDLFTIAVYAAAALLEHQSDYPPVDKTEPRRFELYVYMPIRDFPPALSIGFRDSYFYELTERHLTQREEPS